MKLPEPTKLYFPTMLRKMWSGGEVQDWVNEQGSTYTEAQMRQAIKDALEEAAELCETFDATHPQYLAVAIRKLKEQVE